MSASTYIVSGGSRGLGLAIVERLLTKGARVATFSRKESPELARLAASYGAHCHIQSLDGSDSDAVRGFVDRVARRFGRIDYCIANAAIAHEGVLATMRDTEIDAMLAVNLWGPILLARECVRQMLVQPAGDASIVFMSSVVAMRGSPGLSVYAATKAGIEGFALNLARELAPRGIRVNVVAPGFLVTELSASLSQANRERIARRTALGRLGSAADVVGAVEYLTDESASFVTAEVLAVDGGA